MWSFATGIAQHAGRFGENIVAIRRYSDIGNAGTSSVARMGSSRVAFFGQLLRLTPFVSSSREILMAETSTVPIYICNLRSTRAYCAACRGSREHAGT